MSAVDTPEAVERLIRVVAGQLGGEYAEMISRLHARAVEAEAALATARADALREAVQTLEAEAAHYTEWSAGELCDGAAAAILALIPEKPHAE